MGSLIKVFGFALVIYDGFDGAAKVVKKMTECVVLRGGIHPWIRLWTRSPNRLLGGRSQRCGLWTLQET